MISLVEKLNEDQREAVLHLDGPVLVLAGAGSGKTRVLTHRMAYLINKNGIKPYNILAVTFTNKAAAEMKERIVNLLGFDSPDLWVSTFHSAAVRILRREIGILNFPSNFVIFDTSEQKTLIKECMKELDINDKLIPYQIVMNRISRAKNELVSPEHYANQYKHHYLSQIVDLYFLYQKKLRQNNALDFDDLIFFLVKLFRTHNEVLQKYQKLFHYIMIDEYQDINKAQYHLLKALSEKHRNLFVVGDEDQSIYGFRGADMNIILNFERDFSEARVIKLQQNYRSSQSILNVANKLVSNNRKRREKELWTENTQGDKPFCYEALDERDEAIFVIDEIKKLSRLEERKLSDFVILYRTNAQSRVFEEVLIGEGLPYQIIGGLRFYERKEIKDVLAYLRLIANPSDSLALKRIINVPPRGIGDKTIDKLIAFSSDTGKSLYELLTDEDFLKKNKFSSRASEALTSFKTLIDGLRAEVSDMKLPKLLEEILGRSGYMKSLKDQNTVEAVSRIENLEELLKVSEEFLYRHIEGTLEDFLSQTSLVSDIDMLDENETITLMTVHSAKGLEFPVVFVTGMEENIFPHQRSIDTDSELEIEEERRLAYVAVTRAMGKLYLSYAWRRTNYGGSVYNEPSRFLEEMSSCIDRPIEQKDLFASSFEEADSMEIELARVKSQSAAPKSAFYRRGDSVNHREFGQGVVLEVIGSGLQHQLKVSFPKVGLRKVDLTSLL